MKPFRNILIVLALMGASFALTACGDNPPSLEDRPQQVDIFAGPQTYSGTVDAIPLSPYQEGTHKLKTAEGRDVIIESQAFNLNKYLGKTITVTGTFKKPLGDSLPVLNVSTLQSEGGPDTAVPQDYENKVFGFKFTHPASWEVAEETAKVRLSEGGYDWTTIGVSTTEGTLDDYVKAHETTEGAAVTVGAQKSMRFTDGEKLTLYVPNPSKQKMYTITFNPEKRDPAANKQLFYDLISSFTLFTSDAAVGGAACGGAFGLCPDGFRCELKSSDADSAGTCVSVSAEGTNTNCPFVPQPANCQNPQVASTNKDGCPTRYVCLDPGSTTVPAPAPTDQPTGDGSLPSAAPDTLPPTPAAVQPTTPVPTGGTPPESGGAGGGTPTALAPVPAPSTLPADMRLYENSQKSFTVQYPKKWYFQSFGGIDGTIWSVGFADKPVEAQSDVVLWVRLVPASDASGYTSDSTNAVVSKKRDDKSVFVIKGPKTLGDLITSMAGSLTF